MKKIISFNLILLVGLAACSDSSSDYALETIVPTLNLETCQLIGRNGLTFSALNSVQTFNVGHNPTRENANKRRNKGGETLTFNEYTLDLKLDNELNKIAAIISQELGEEPEKRTAIFQGYVQTKWKAGNIILQGGGDLNEMYPVLYFNPDKIKVIPNINSKSSFDYLYTLFADRIYRDGNDHSSDSLKYLKINCNGSIITLLTIDERAEKSDLYKGKVNPTLVNIGVDLYHVVNNHKAPPSVNRKTPFAIGDRVNVIFTNGSKCKATILIAGKKQSKIEYNEYCETGFISSKSMAEIEWAPNNALSAR